MNAANQLPLDFGLTDRPIERISGKGLTIDERFEAFHQANPHVYRAFVRLCRFTVQRGQQRWSAKAAFEVLRWSYGMQTRGDEFVLNNDYTSRYARKAMDEHPDLSGFFATRALKAA